MTGEDIGKEPESVDDALRLAAALLHDVQVDGTAG